MQSIDAIVSYLGDRALSVSGDTSMTVEGFAAALPGREGFISFISGPSESVSRAISQSDSRAFLAPPGASSGIGLDKLVVEVAAPRLEFARVANKFFPVVEDSSCLPGVHEGASVGAGTFIGPGAVVEAGVVIGTECVIGANAVIRYGTVIGDRVRIGPGTVLGQPGFGFARDEQGRVMRVPHYGRVRIGDDVEIGANAVVDRGVFVDTTIKAGVKIDSHVLVGHNVVIEEDALVVGGAVLCGGVRVGRRAWVAPGTAIVEKVVLGDDSTVGIGAAVCRDVPAGEMVMGPIARAALNPSGIAHAAANVGH